MAKEQARRGVQPVCRQLRTKQRLLALSSTSMNAQCNRRLRGDLVFIQGAVAESHRRAATRGATPACLIPTHAPKRQTVNTPKVRPAPAWISPARQGRTRSSHRLPGILQDSWLKRQRHRRKSSGPCLPEVRPFSAGGPHVHHL